MSDILNNLSIRGSEYEIADDYARTQISSITDTIEEIIDEVNINNEVIANAFNDINEKTDEMQEVSSASLIDLNARLVSIESQLLTIISRLETLENNA